MNEAILMSQCHEPEYDLCDLNHALLGPPSEGDGTPTMLEVPWTYPIQDMRYSPRRSLRNAQKKTLIESEAPNHGFDSVFELVDDLAEPDFLAPGRDVGQAISGAHPSLLGQPHLSPEALLCGNQTFETTSSEPSRDSPTSVRRTPSTSVSSASLAGPRETSPTRQHRERNRIAARKCRQKAKRSISELQERERELSQQNRMLVDHASSLREEILYLKNEILRHSECNSSIIQDYITNAARRQMG